MTEYEAAGFCEHKTAGCRMSRGALRVVRLPDSNVTKCTIDGISRSCHVYVSVVGLIPFKRICSSYQFPICSDALAENSAGQKYCLFGPLFGNKTFFSKRVFARSNLGVGHKPSLAAEICRGTFPKPKNSILHPLEDVSIVF